MADVRGDNMKPKRFEYKGKEYRAYIDSNNANSLLWIHVDRRTKNKYFFKWKQYTDEVQSLSEGQAVIDLVLEIIDKALEKEAEMNRKNEAVENWNTWQGGIVHD